MTIRLTVFSTDLYAPTMGSCPATDRVFADIRKRVDREVRTQRQLMMLQGALDLVLTASRNAEKPHLTCEEKALKERLKSDKSAKIDMNSCLYKSLMQ